MSVFALPFLSFFQSARNVSLIGFLDFAVVEEEDLVVEEDSVVEDLVEEDTVVEDEGRTTPTASEVVEEKKRE